MISNNSCFLIYSKAKQTFAIFIYRMCVFNIFILMLHMRLCVLICSKPQNFSRNLYGAANGYTMPFSFYTQQVNELVYNKGHNKNTLFHKHATESKQQPTNSPSQVKIRFRLVFLLASLQVWHNFLRACCMDDVSLSLAFPSRDIQICRVVVGKHVSWFGSLNLWKLPSCIPAHPFSDSWAKTAVWERDMI